MPIKNANNMVPYMRSHVAAYTTLHKPATNPKKIKVKIIVKINDTTDDCVRYLIVYDIG